MGNVLRITIVVCVALSNAHCGQKGGLTRPSQASITASFSH